MIKFTRYFSFKIFIILLILIQSNRIYSQTDTIHYNVDLMGLTSKGKYAPFWLHSRQYGTVSASPSSASLLLNFSKNFDHKDRLFDYGFGASGLASTASDTSQVYIHELYLKARLLVFDMALGVREENYGNQDESLSGGGILFSKNARPIPKLFVGIENFTPIPFTKGYVEVKGGISHGQFIDNIGLENTLLHHKFAYFRFGGNLPVRLQYGLNHVAQWGGKGINRPSTNPTPTLGDFWRIFKGSAGGEDANLSDQINVLGNHIINQDLRLDIDVNNFTIGAYWQNINEDTPLRIIGKTMNYPDGLWGISIHNNSFPYVSGLLYELLNTTDMSGPFHDRDGIVYGGSDSYFINGEFPAGWSHFSRTIGTPFITSPLYNEDHALCTQNNSVRVHHFGIEGEVFGFRYKTFASFSKNYGSYARYANAYKRNSSYLLDVKRNFSSLSNIEIGCSLGVDRGELMGNNYGVSLSLRKTGLLSW